MFFIMKPIENGLSLHETISSYLKTTSDISISILDRISSIISEVILSEVV